MLLYHENIYKSIGMADKSHLLLPTKLLVICYLDIKICGVCLVPDLNSHTKTFIR